MAERKNGRGNGDEQRKWILFWAGLGGTFIYLVLSTLLHEFRVEWLGAFLMMAGVPLFTGLRP